MDENLMVSKGIRAPQEFWDAVDAKAAELRITRGEWMRRAALLAMGRDLVTSRVNSADRQVHEVAS